MPRVPAAPSATAFRPLLNPLPTRCPAVRPALSSSGRSWALSFEPKPLIEGETGSSAPPMTSAIRLLLSLGLAGAILRGLDLGTRGAGWLLRLRVSCGPLLLRGQEKRVVLIPSR